MQEDINRTIARAAKRYTDQSCPQLHFDELVAEGQYKLAQLIDRGELERQDTRQNFFKYMATAVANQMRSLVQKHRFTRKRTGVSPPPRKDRFQPITDEHDLQPHKMVEVSLDDPNAHVQVGEPAHVDDSEHEVFEDYEQLLTPREVLVFRQLAYPNARSRLQAELDAHVGRKRGAAFKVRIRDEHHAFGLDIPIELWKKTVLSVRSKILAYNAMATDELTEKAHRSAVIQQLCEVFNVQVPPTVDEIVVQRLFTIAARDQMEKVNDQVAELLAQIGAKKPQVYGDMLSCWGVLYQRTNKICAICGLKEACALESANLGLGKVVPSAKLLGVKQTRIPSILPSVLAEGETPSKPPHTVDREEMEVLAYLDENFDRMNRRGQEFFIHKDSPKRRLVFCLVSRTSPLQLRFCGPSDELRAKLDGKQKTWWLPTRYSAAEAIALIDQHAKETYQDAD